MGGIVSGLLGGGGKNTVQEQQRVTALRIQSSFFGLPIPLAFGQNRVPANLAWYADFTAIAHSSTSDSGGGGKGGGSNATQTNITYTYTAAAVLGICEGPIDDIIAVWQDKNRSTPDALGLTKFLGSYSQNPFSYITTNHPGEALSYRGLAYVASAAYDLGSSAAFPNHNFEIAGLEQFGAALTGGKTFTAGRVKVVTVATDTIISPLSDPENTFYSTISWFASVAHGFSNGDAFLIATSPGGVPPAGLTAGATYYVVNATADLFFVALSASGEPLVFGDATGTVYASTAQFASTAHGFNNNDALVLTTSGTLPAPLALATVYYAQNVTANAFSLATEPDGPVIVFTTAGTGTQTATPWIRDANPPDILTAFLTNANFGAGFPSGNLGDWSQWSDFCVASGILLSPVLVAQAAAADFVKRICDLSIAAPFYSEGLLKVVPYGDQVVTGNGVTYTPDVAVQYALTEDDFIQNGTSDPVVCKRNQTADAFNQKQIAFANRDNQYNNEVAEAKDQANIEDFGLRPDQQDQGNEIVTAAVARQVVQAMLQRKLYIRNTYEFTLPWKYARLEPMDVVTLTTTGLGLSAYPVRLTEVTEGEDGFEIIAEDFPAAVSAASVYPNQASAGYRTLFNASPGSISPPMIVDAPGAATVSGFEIWAGAFGSGNPNWGGCEQWVSLDGNSYKKVGTIYGPARAGLLLSDFPVTIDPDTTAACSVDLTTSLGQLLSGTQADADNLATLCWVGGEFISYETATLTAAYQYDLETYLRRGAYNTEISDHIARSPFLRCDQAMFRYAYDPALVGSTIYMKFPSFNAAGVGLEDLADIPAYSATIQGPAGCPDDVTGFAAGQNGVSTVFSWNLNDDPNISGYEIRYLPLTLLTLARWEDGTPLTQVTKGTSVTSVRVAPGSWTFMIKAHDTSNKYSKNPAFVNLAATNANVIIADAQAAPDWFTRDYALSFGGTTSDYISNVGSPTVVTSGSFFDFIWITPAVIPGSGKATLWDSQTGGAGVTFSINNNGKLNLSIFDGTHTVTGDIGSALTSGQRYQVGLKVNRVSGIATVYLNGVPDAATLNIAAVTGALAAGPTRFGVTLAGTNPYQGTMDELLCYADSTDATGEVLVDSDVELVYLGHEIGLHNPAAEAITTFLKGCLFHLNFDGPGTDDGGGLFVIHGNVTFVPSTCTSKFVRHWTGVLVPDDQHTAAFYGWETFDDDVPTPFDICKNPALWIDLGVSAPVRIYAKTTAVLMPNQTDGVAAPFMQVSKDSSALSPPPTPKLNRLFQGSGSPTSAIGGIFTALFAVPTLAPWDMSVVTTRYFIGRVMLDTRNGIAAVTGFEQIADAEIDTQQAQGVTVAPGGTTVTFSPPFHSTPSVQVTPSGVATGDATATAISNTGFTAHVNADAGGTANWMATGS